MDYFETAGEKTDKTDQLLNHQKTFELLQTLQKIASF